MKQKFRSDEGLTLETSAFSIYINSFDKTKFLFHSSTDPVPKFL